MLEFLGGHVVTVDDDDLTSPSRSIRLCAFDDGVQDGSTALHMAAFDGHAVCVELLLKHMNRGGVELKDNVRNLKQSLSLSLSSSTRHFLNAVAPSHRYVTFRTILVVSPEQTGNTAKQDAQSQGHTDCVNTFTKHGY